MSSEHQTDEGGFAMIVSMMVITVVMMMTLALLASGLHLEAATVRDSKWNQALQVAEAGADQAVYRISQHLSGTSTGSVAQGTYNVTVDSTSLGPGWLIVTSSGTVGGVTRRLQVTYGPESSFKYALFSDTGLSVKNNNNTTGDIWANESIVLQQNSGVNGSVVSATGSIDLQNGAQIKKNGATGGDAYSGGYDATNGWGIRLQNNAQIQGDAFAEEESCSPPDTSHYNIANAGSILGSALAGGNVNGSVGGSTTPFNCQLRQPTKVLPTFHYDSALYSGTPHTYTSVSALQTDLNANSSHLLGVYYLCDGASSPGIQDCTTPSSNLLDLGGMTMTGNFTLVTNTLITFNNNATYCGPSTATVDLVSLNPSTLPPAINIKNNFQINSAPGCPTASPAVLVYSTGLIFVKNNTESNGAVYAGAISINNNMDVTYDPRVERTVGFGDARYERVSWKELTPS